MSATRTTRVRHERKSLILIAARVRTYFYNFILTIWQVKNHKERNNFYELPFGNASFPCQKAFKKCTTKNSGASQYSSFSKILQNLKHFLNSRVIDFYSKDKNHFYTHSICVYLRFSHPAITCSVNNRNTRARCEIYSKLTIKTSLHLQVTRSSLLLLTLSR